MKANPKYGSRRGRPPKPRSSLLETRELLLRAGLETVTEKGFSAAGLDEILRRAEVPKGSFYYYFKSKEAFGLALIDLYEAYFTHKIKKHLSNTSFRPLERLRYFIDEAKSSMVRYEFKRGCLVGKLGQEINILPQSFRYRLTDVFTLWQELFAATLNEALINGEIKTGLDTQSVAAFFWIGWEGAVLQAALEQSEKPLDTFADVFFALLVR